MQKNDKLHPFGVGSFVFSIDLKTSVKTADVILNLQECLKNIPGIDSLKIEEEFDAPSKLPIGKHTLSFLNIFFEIDVSGDPQFSGNDNIFKVLIRQEFDAPLTIIYSEKETERGSNNIYTVREYIKKYIKGNCNLDVIGPSPFHADFYFKTNSKEFNVAILRQHRDYDKIVIDSTKENFSDVFDEILEHVGSELNLFYLIQSIDSDMILMWSEINNKLQNIKRDTDTSFFRKFKDWFLLNTKITDIMQDIISLESNSIFMSQLIKERYAQTYSTKNEDLKIYIENAIENKNEFPVNSVKKLLDFYISQHNSFNQNLNVSISAIIGGFVGAIISILLKK